MQKQNRLGPNRQFQYVYRRGKRVANKEFVLLYVKNNQKKVGFSVSKKIGNAVTRNTVKRRLRECFRALLPEVRKGLYVVVARPGADRLPYAEVNRCIHSLLKKSGAFLSSDNKAQ